MKTMKLHVKEHEEAVRSHCRLPKLSIFAHGVIYINQFAELKDKRKPGKQSRCSEVGSLLLYVSRSVSPAEGAVRAL